MAETLRIIANRFGQQRLIWVVNVLMLLLLGQALASLTWRMLEEKSPEPEFVERPVVGTATTQSPQKLAQQIANWHLYGNARKVAVSAGPTIAPETKLNLLLRGVLASPDSASSAAIIATGTKAADKSYGIDDSLPGGAVLKEIYGDRVILEYRGRMETLTLLRKKLSAKELRVEEKVRDNR